MNDREGPLFRPVRQSWRAGSLRRHLDPDLIDRIVRKYVREIGLHRGFSAHSMRATFITRAPDNGASLEEVQRAGGHAEAFPVVAVTASVMDLDRRRILAAGFDAYVGKPVNIRELIETLQSLLAQVPP